MKKKLLCTAAALALLLSGCGADTAESQTPIVTESQTIKQEEIADPFGAQAVSSGFDFSVTDLSGQPFTFADCKNAKVIMINFWEPWCGPCVSEMPDIEKLYETYKADGLLILGVFSTPNRDEYARAVVEDCGITYPILHGTDDAFRAMETEYVPTTVFLNADGTLLNTEPLVGAQSYETLESAVREYLQ